MGAATSMMVDDTQFLYSLLILLCSLFLSLTLWLVNRPYRLPLRHTHLTQIELALAQHIEGLEARIGAQRDLCVLAWHHQLNEARQALEIVRRAS